MNNGGRNIKRSLITFNIILISGLAALFILTNTFTHSLSRNGSWSSSKTALEKGVMGSWSFMLTYRALAGNQLNLGTWHGYQEIFLDKPLPYSKASFDFMLDENACLVIFYETNSDTLTAIRVSNNPAYDNALLRVVNNRFIEKSDITIPELNPGWNSIILNLNDNNTTLTLNDGRNGITELPAVNNDAILGFRNYESSAIIDNVILAGMDGEILFRETFHWKPSFLHWFILLLLAGNIVFISIPPLRRTLLIVGVNVSVIIFVILLIFLLYGRYQYPKEWMINWKSRTTTIQTEGEVLEKTLSGTKVHRSDTLKIVSLGSSQTWGAGATKEELTFLSLLEKMLNDSLQFPVRCINAGISGINSGDVLRIYQGVWLDAGQELCIVNLSVNDAGNTDFRQNIEEIIRLNNNNRITTILIPEPVDGDIKSIIRNHKIIFQLAEENLLRVPDIQSYLDERYDDGFIFWDFVHLTDFGHRLFAERLYQELQQTINETITAKENER